MSRPGLAFTLGILLAVAGPRSAAGQSGRPGELVTDRPDFTESAEVVAPGWLQLETGFETVRYSEQGVQTSVNSAPLPLFRLGLSKRLELRFGGVSYVWQRERAGGGHRGRIGGVADLEIGAKIKLAEEGSSRPALAVIPLLILPTGSEPVSGSSYDPGIVLAWAKGLPLGFAAGGNVGLAAASDERGRFLEKAASVSVSRAIAPRGVAGFLETYLIGPDGRGGRYAWVVTSGVTAPLGRDAQLDFYLARSMRGPLAYWAFGAGFVFRVPVGLPRR